MGIAVLVLGESGSGKSTSLRNFDPEEVGVFNVAGKPLPFRKVLKVSNNIGYADIEKKLLENKFKTYVIDDTQYLMAFELFDNAKVTGYGKFTDIAIHFKNLIDLVRAKLPKDVIVYFLHHTEISENGRLKAKTTGKMLDQQLTLEGLFSIVLLCTFSNSKHMFITNSDGTSPAKSPMEMLEQQMDNDLKIVDTKIREYWGLQ